MVARKNPTEMPPTFSPSVVAIFVEGHVPQNGADHEGSDLRGLLLHSHRHPGSAMGFFSRGGRQIIKYHQKEQGFHQEGRYSS